ncbi:MAG: hypothetical protein HRT61_25110 [Ekhidna sp.]|nr:hypothetical protein [Ekhidna sp.]
MTKIRTSQKYKSKDSPLYYFLGAVIGIIMLPFWLLSIAVILGSSSGFTNPIAMLGIIFNLALFIAILITTYKKVSSSTPKSKKVILVTSGVTILIVSIYAPIRYYFAIGYMNNQIERLNQEGKGQYKIKGIKLVNYDDIASFSMTLTAQELGDLKNNPLTALKLTILGFPSFSHHRTAYKNVAQQGVQANRSRWRCFPT